MSSAPSSRILTFDYLRGFFILIILIDHLWRWPNIFSFISGEGRLWVTAAEGFVIISGLLVGYIRGYKNRREPWSMVAGKLLRRAGVLYLWSVITTIVFTGSFWLFFLQGSHGAMPYVSLSNNDWPLLIKSALTLEYAHIWTFFLHLYTIFLILGIPVIVLLRRQLWWLVILLSGALWTVGIWLQVEWLIWQILFFLPATAGYHLEAIRRFLTGLSLSMRRSLKVSVLCFTVLSMFVSMLIEFHGNTLQTALSWTPAIYMQFTHTTQSLFSHEARSFAWVMVSFIWFIAFYMLFQAALPWLQRWLGWLLEPFGTRSLTAYILHGVPMVVTLYIFVNSTNIWLNSLLTLANILATWALVESRWLQKIIPR
ncbi:MAG TPA: OpgC domain-containing protein [Candidatus Saccharimonadales bacterium]